MRSALFRLCLAAGLTVLAASPALADRDGALARAKAQTGVVDARIDDRGTLWVMVKKQTANWDTYAAVMCKLMQPYHALIFSVRVVDFTTIGRFRTSDDWTQLGAAKCE